MRRWLILGCLLVTMLAACQSEDEADPEIVVITATRSRPTDSALEPTQRPTDPPIFPSSTPIPTDTFIPTSPTPLVIVTNTLSIDQLPVFPTSTASPTIEGVDSPTPYRSPTPTNTPGQFPTATFPGTTPTQNAGGAATAFVTGVPGPQLTPTVTSEVVFEIASVEGNVEYPPAISNLAPRPEELPIIDVRTLGMQIHPFVTLDEWRNALGLTKQLKMGWIKVQIPWEAAEPEAGQFTDLYRQTVSLVQRAHLEGFKVLVSVNRAPYWARPPGADLTRHGPPSDPNAYAQFINKLIVDIEPQFIDAIEIWNEPNLVREWAGVPMNGGEYMRFFEPAYYAARAADPEIIVVTAGLAPVGDIPNQAEDDRQFLREMYAAGLMNFPDARIGLHPYGWANSPDERCCSVGSWKDAPQFFMLDTIEEYRQIALDNGDSGRKFWLTEFGWGTYKGISRDAQDAPPPDSAQFFDLVSLEQQARYVMRAIEIFQKAPYAGYVEMAFLWNMNYATLPNAIEGRGEQAGYSLLDASGRPRLVFWYLLNTRKIR